ncbi:MAG: aldo/keto reductase [Herpetosiphonaceae bacterium]|nr:aldo/keto reductase [Herpetosiphonaceae bacterium]
MMIQRPLGKTGLRVSALGFGGAPIGFAPAQHAASFVALVERAVDLGITLFDTAPDYRHSEELLGRALRSHRRDVVLATKCGRLQPWNGYDWIVREDWSAEGIVATVDESLRRLQTDYLDVVQLHSPPRWVLDDGAAIQGLVRAQEAGKIRHLGVSADGDDARRALELGVFATLQTSYSILQQAPGDDVLPAAAEQGLGLIIKQPIANGIPLLRQRPSHPDWSWKWDIAQQLDWQVMGAEENRLQFALRWVLANPLVSSAIVGTTRLEHLLANVVAAELPALDAASFQVVQHAYVVAQQTGRYEEP